jgi:hypothetical protein
MHQWSRLEKNNTGKTILARSTFEQNKQQQNDQIFDTIWGNFDKPKNDTINDTQAIMTKTKQL